jgi:hypothetical protein
MFPAIEPAMKRNLHQRNENGISEFGENQGSNSQARGAAWKACPLASKENDANLPLKSRWRINRRKNICIF